MTGEIFISHAKRFPERVCMTTRPRCDYLHRQIRIGSTASRSCQRFASCPSMRTLVNGHPRARLLTQFSDTTASPPGGPPPRAVESNWPLTTDTQPVTTLVDNYHADRKSTRLNSSHL